MYEDDYEALMFPSASSQEGPYDRLLDLATMLVISEGHIGSIAAPLEMIEQAVNEASATDGDVAVMASRATGVLLDKFGGSLATAKKTGAKRSAERHMASSLRCLKKIFSLTTRIASLSFDKTTRAELVEELLLCLSCALTLANVKLTLPAVHDQLAFCVTALDGSTLRVRSKVLRHCTAIVRSGAIEGSDDWVTLRRILESQLNLLEGIHVDYEWDDIFRAVVEGIVTFRVYCRSEGSVTVSSPDASPQRLEKEAAISPHSAGKRGKKRKTERCASTRTGLAHVEEDEHQNQIVSSTQVLAPSPTISVGKVFTTLCVQMGDDRTPSSRRKLVYAATATLTNSDELLTLPDTTRADLCAHLIKIVEAGVVGKNRFSNPFSRADGEGAAPAEDNALAVLPNLQWMEPELQWSAIVLLAKLAGCRLALVSDYLWAWRDNTDTYHPYPRRRREELTRTFFSGESERVLDSLTGHHRVDFAHMTQVNERTLTMRRVHFQPIPFEQTVTGPPVVSPVPVTLPPCIRDALPVLQAAAYGSTSFAKLAEILSFFILTCSPPVDAYSSDTVLIALRSLVSSSSSRTVESFAADLLRQSPVWATELRAAGVDEALAQCCHREDIGESRKSAQSSTGEGRLASSASQRSAGVNGGKGSANKRTREDSPATPSSAAVVKIIRSVNQSPHLTPQLRPSDLPDTLQSVISVVRSATYADLLLLVENCTVLRAQSMVEAARAHADVYDKLWSAAVSVSIRRLQEISVSNRKERLTSKTCAQVVPLVVCQQKREADGVPNDRKECPNGHPLKKHFSFKWTCDRCGKSSEAASLACRTCDYDLCYSCVSQKDPSQVDVSVTATVADVLAYVSNRGSNGEQVPNRNSPMIASTEMLLREMLRAAVPQKLHSVSQPVLCTASGQLWTGGTPISVVKEYGVTSCLHCSPADGQCVCGVRAPTAVSGMYAPRLPDRESSQQPEEEGNSHATGAHAGNDGLTDLLSGLQQCRKKTMMPPGLEHSLVEALEASSVSIFLRGFYGLSANLRSILSACQRSLPLAIRKDMCAFLSFGCRRFAVYHIQESSYRVGGDITAEIESNGLATKAAVDRDAERLVDQLYETFRRYPTMRNRVEFTFVGEAGTGEGPTQEVYSEVSQALKANPNLWYRTDEGTSVAFPSNTVVNTKAFFVLGCCMARSFIDGYTMDVELEPCMWHVLTSFSDTRSLRDSKLLNAAAMLRTPGDTIALSGPFASFLSAAASDLQPELTRSYEKTLAMTPEELSALSLENDEGQILTTANVRQFVEDQIRKQFSGSLLNAASFMEGFCSVVEAAPFSLIQPEEMNTLFCGLSMSGEGALFNEAELRSAIVEAHGYVTGSKEVDMFVQIVANELSRAEQHNFVEFLTGCPRLPLGGLTGLSRKITIVKKEMEDSQERTLPSCNTCFLYFKLPPYTTHETMKKRLLTAIVDGRKNFSLS